MENFQLRGGGGVRGGPSTVRVDQMAKMIKAILLARHIKEDAVPSEIIPKLWLGSIGAANNKEFMKEHGITHILTVGRGLKALHPDDFTYKQVDVLDSPQDDLASHFNACHGFLDNGIERGGGVLVHCFAGKSRSSTIVISYLMKHHRMSLDGALRLCQSKRRVVGPNVGFLMQLKSYDLALGGTGVVTGREGGSDL